MMNHTAAVILAAGLSSRMGTFKPLLEIGEKTMIQRITDLMFESGVNPVVVVTGHKSKELEFHLAGKPIIFIHNARYSETQMLDSLILGLFALPRTTRRVLVTPCDIPLIKADTIQTLLHTEGPFVRPTYNGKRGHPIVMDFGLLPILQQYQGNGGLKDAIAASGIPASDIAVHDPGITMDSDTPGEYCQLLNYYQQIVCQIQPPKLDLQSPF